MSERDPSRVRSMALLALVAILVAFGVTYYYARSGERGTARDDSPAAEAGLRRDANNNGDGGKDGPR